MSAQTNAFSETRFGTDAIAEPRVRRTRPVYWSVKRELWENRSIYLVPLAAAALVVVGTIIGAIHGTGMLLSLNPAQQAAIIAGQWSLTGLLIMASTFIVAIFYCLDALYGERRDRSVLFWRSLPVSDTVAVLSKAGIAMVLLPLLTFVVAAITQWIVLAIDAALLAAHGRSLQVIGQVPLIATQGMLLYHLVAVHALWYAPIYAWLLLISAWARRAPLLWAFLPPLLLALGEKIALNTRYFSQFIAYRLSEGPSGANLAMQKPMLLPSVAGPAPLQFLVSPGLWGGLFVAGLFLAGAVWLRRYRTAN